MMIHYSLCMAERACAASLHEPSNNDVSVFQVKDDSKRVHPGMVEFSKLPDQERLDNLQAAEDTFRCSFSHVFTRSNTRNQPRNSLFKSFHLKDPFGSWCLYWTVRRRRWGECEVRASLKQVSWKCSLCFIILWFSLFRTWVKIVNAPNNSFSSDRTL